MTDTNQLPPLPTLKPSDSHMESLIEAAIQGHADTREAMRWLVRQLVPATQPAEVTDDEQQAIDQIMEQAQVFASAWSLVGGRFDSGYALDDALEAKEELREMVARAILALRPSTAPNLSCKSVQARLADQWGYVCPAAAPMSDEYVQAACGDIFASDHTEPGAYDLAIWRKAETAHGITAQAKKEDA